MPRLEDFDSRQGRVDDFWGGGWRARKGLRDVFERVAEAGGLDDLRKAVEAVDGFLELLSDPKVDFRVKLMDYVRVRQDVLAFCDYYARWLGTPLMERLKAEVDQLLEEAITWRGRREIIDGVKG